MPVGVWKVHSWVFPVKKRQNLVGAACPLGMRTPSACSTASPSAGALYRILGCSEAAPQALQSENQFPRRVRVQPLPGVWAARGSACPLSRPAFSPSTGTLHRDPLQAPLRETEAWAGQC